MMSSMTRLWASLRATVLVAVLLFACEGRPVVAQTALPTVRVGLLPAIISGQAYFAQNLGFFQKHGLSVQLQTMNSGSAIAAAVSGGALDIGYSDIISISNAHLHGLTFAYVAGAIAITPAARAGLLIRPDSGISDARSLSGKTIGVNALGNISQIMTQAWADANGGDSKSLKFLEIPLPQQVAAVQQNTVAAALASEPFFAIGVAQGLKTVVFTKNGIAPTWLAGGWFADQAWIAKNRDIAEAFAAAMREAAVWANANPAAADQIIATDLKLPIDILRTLILQPAFAEDLRASEIQPLIDAGVKYGVLAKQFPAGELIARLR
jgi:NitT/TauT family transport system substrate-binding protein